MSASRHSMLDRIRAKLRGRAEPSVRESIAELEANLLDIHEHLTAQ